MTKYCRFSLYFRFLCRVHTSYCFKNFFRIVFITIDPYLRKCQTFDNLKYVTNVITFRLVSKFISCSLKKHGILKNSQSFQTAKQGLYLDTLDAQRLQKIRELETVEVKQEVEKEVVHEKPVFLTPLNNLDLKEGEHAHLECRVEPINDPNLKIEWYLNQ